MDTLGLDAVIRECDRLAAAYGDIYRVPDLLREMAEQGKTFYGDACVPSPGARIAA
jgi:3-hydroxyacyl-CoA dehydrogenase/enoyl-CoA hydratase/3-hydroxybutyryl-CoA epimerase